MVSLWERSGQPLVNETSSDSSSNDSTMPMSMTHDANRAVQPAAIAAFALVGVAVLALSLYLTFKLAMQKKARAREALLSSFSQVSTGSTLNSVDLEKKALFRQPLSATTPVSILRPNATVPPSHSQLVSPSIRTSTIRPDSPPMLTRINTGVTIITIPEPTVTQQRPSSVLPPRSPNDFKAVQSGYHPLLADELSVQVGERLLILEEFDDGWCIVSRETLVKWDLNMGAVPVFVFEKGVQGMKERGVRTTSLSKNSGESQGVFGGGKRLVASTWGNLKAKV